MPTQPCCFVVVGWSPADALEEPLASLRGAARPEDEIRFVDNRRLPATRALLDALGDPRIHYVDPGRNGGFAAAVNRGVEVGAGPPFSWWVICSDDSVIESRFRDVLDELEGDPKIGIVGPRVFAPNEPGAQFASRWVGMWNGSMVDAADAGGRYSDTGYVEGRCLAVKAEALNQSGPLDETFFVYWEEVDLCYRVREHGWRVVVDLQTKVRDAGKSAATSRLREYLLVRNRIYFVGKHGKPPMLVGTVAWVLTVRLGQAILRHGGSQGVPLILADRFRAVRDGLRLIIRRPTDPASAALTKAW